MSQHHWGVASSKASFLLVFLFSFAIHANGASGPQPGQISSAVQTQSAFNAKAAALEPSQPAIASPQPIRPRRLARDFWWASMGAVVAATTLDAASSWGHREGNSLLASRDGAFGPKGLTIKIATAAAVLTPQIILRRHSGMLRTFAIANAAESAFYTAAAVHNFQITSR